MFGFCFFFPESANWKAQIYEDAQCFQGMIRMVSIMGFLALWVPFRFYQEGHWLEMTGRAEGAFWVFSQQPLCECALT